MRKVKLIIVGLVALLPSLMVAQTYQWQWAKQAGGYEGSANSGYTYSEDESIRDIAVDSSNNTYYLATTFAQGQNIDGVPITIYKNRDLVLFSTDCLGNLRWSTTIGGSGSSEFAWNIKVDNNGGLYIMATIYNDSQIGDPNGVPIHLDPTHTLPSFAYNSNFNTVDAGHKSSFLLKYNTSDGLLVWNKALQGDVSFNTRYTDTNMMYMDAQKKIHAIVGFRAGTHLNGTVTVPSTVTTGYQYYLVKFNYDNGNMTQSTPVLLPVDGLIGSGVFNGNVNLLYDENLQQYYLAGTRGTFNSLFDFSFKGIPLTKEAFLIAFNVTGSSVNELWRREIITGKTVLDDEIHSIIKDANSSDIYIAGRYYSDETTPVTFGNHMFPIVTYGIQRPFVMKLNSDGNVLWSKIPDDIPANVNRTAYRFMRGALVQNGNEIGFAHGSWGSIWGNYSLVRSSGYGSDPILVRLNKDNGSVIGLGEVWSNAGKQDEFTAMAVDRDGNYILGGFFHGQLFTDANDNIPTMLMNVPTGKSQNFFTKYAKSACSTMSVEETPLEAGIQFFPNPVQDMLNVKSKTALESFEIYSSVGQHVRSGSLQNTHAQINMTGLTAGVYYVKLKTQNSTVTEKVVKK